MNENESIYRVTVRTTGSLQPGGDCCSTWREELLYCGTNLTDARVAYLASEVQDSRRGFGSPARETWIERLEADPDDLADTTADTVDID